MRGSDLELAPRPYTACACFSYVLFYNHGVLSRSNSIASSGFPSLDEVRGNGSMLVNTITYDNIGRMLLPSMNFTCDGNITKLTFLAVQGPAPTSDLYYIFGRIIYSWRPDVIVQGGTFQMNASKAVLVGGSGTGYELKFDSEFEFHAGDMLSVYQIKSSRHHLLHQVGQVIEGCSFVDGLQGNICELKQNIARPLIAVETGMLF